MGPDYNAPDKPTRNRKPLAPPGALDAAWELRLGPKNRFRVFYEFDQAKRVVSILAIGVKQASRLVVGGEESEERQVLEGGSQAFAT
jgi:hypothetical protein